MPAYEHPALRHLHYESPTQEEFVRKWTALATSGPSPGMRERRAAVLQAFIDLADQSDKHARAAHSELFASFAADDLEGLAAAGVLESVDLAMTDSEPFLLAATQQEALGRALEEASARPKRSFLPPSASAR